MVWDCLIAWVVVVFTMVGWSAGLVGSWTVPISMAVATLISKRLYIDMATLLVEVVHFEPTFAVFISYLFTWLWLVQYCDVFLSYLARTRVGNNPSILSKLVGGTLGFSKGFGAFVLAAMVAYAQNHVPEPDEISRANLWILHAGRDSHLLPELHVVAMQLDQPIGKFVLSNSTPRIHADPNLVNDPFSSVEKREQKRGFDFVRSWAKFQKDLDNQ